MKKLFVFILTLMLISFASVTSFAAIDVFYLQDGDTGEVYGYTMEDLIASLNGDMILWNYFNDGINNGSMALYAVHDDTSEKYIDFGNLVTAVNNGDDITEFTEGYAEEGASMPQEVTEITVNNGEIAEEVVSITTEVTGTVTKSDNTPMFGMTTITVTLEGTNTPEDYTVTIDGTEIPYKDADGAHALTVASSDALAQMTEAELQEALVFEGTEDTNADFQVIDIQ